MNILSNKLKLYSLLALCLLLAGLPSISQAQQFRALVLSKTSGFRHQSIPEGVAAIKKLADKHRFDVYATEDASLINDKNLEKYDVIIMMSTTGTILNADEKAAFERFVKSGKGIVGVHSATDTEYDWPWYTKLIGGQFNNHPHQQTARIKVMNGDHPSTYHLNDKWLWTDEWYEFKNFNSNVNILLQLDESSYNVGERNGKKNGHGCCPPDLLVP
ncbi:Cytochrome c551/c552 [Cyclobacterium qasimii M12-11B]|uniref:Cytochrome c551/c552 n=1 Tax=Cyclobacterium qasimii M12-11B TaxID=641524 RepID=S7V984_9BACT|nr:ThuA domain-containing protein [Cyclobacterium qasimii]EPR66486.1 Cytochrome c551/c552 [Cyclobacterium qasimii M12-11B]